MRWGDLTLSYDAAGNMLSDGSNAFTWDARGQVSSVNAVSPLYDAFGRRTKNLAGTQMLFDGANSVQEIVGSTVTANRLTGGVDEFFSRADSTGTYYPLSDNLGSTVALTDSTPNVVTADTYDPYGTTSISGSNSNFFDYTGRENDGNGIYYYRARYYDSNIYRFVSLDPLGYSSGSLNLYSYARNSPLDLVDPMGGYICPITSPQCRNQPVKHLTDCAKRNLKPYFPGLNLDSVEFYPELPGLANMAPTGDGGAGAITWDNVIYYDPSQFNNGASGLGAIGHELTHVQQQSAGLTLFLAEYLGSWTSNLFSSGNAYQQIPQEVAAYATGDKIEADLFGRKGFRDVCTNVLQ